MGRNFIWLFGENLAATSNNNSYYFWKQVVRRRDGIDKYIVLEKNAANKETYASLSDKEKSFVVWKNTVKHFKIYLNADMYFVSLSYKDITPTKLGFFKTDFFIEKPLIYLQHGTLGIKAIEYKGYGYNNNMFRFLYYNKNIKPTLMDYNKFKDYQLYYGIYPPRYIELVKRHKAYHAQPHNGKNILWFMTWREYLGDNYMTQMLMHQIKGVLSSQKLADYLDKTNSVFTVCLHQFFDEEKIEEFKECAKNPNISEKGFVIYYTDQCPFTYYWVPRVQEAAKENNIPLKVIHITDKESAQNVPAPVTTYALFKDGKFVTQAIQSDKKFLALAGIKN